jgi:uncharacterized protein YbaR (Trm112 family)
MTTSELWAKAEAEKRYPSRGHDPREDPELPRRDAAAWGILHVLSLLESEQAVEAGARTSIELICDVCGRSYPIWFAPNEVWNLGSSERPGMECPSCFATKYELHVGHPIVWSFAPSGSEGSQ